MAREPKCRRVSAMPRFTLFKPVGVARPRLNENVIKVEELEALRLKDILGLEQGECADSMRVSRPTFQRILLEGRRKVAEALIEGKMIRIEGGDYCLGQENCRKASSQVKNAANCLYPSTGEMSVPGLGSAMTGSRIAICADTNTPDAVVDGRFGRCPYFLLWDEDEHHLEPLINHGIELPQGAGTGAVQELLAKGVGKLVCNRIGPNALTLFKQAGALVYQAPQGMSIDLVLDKLQAGELGLIT